MAQGTFSFIKLPRSFDFAADNGFAQDDSIVDNLDCETILYLSTGCSAIYSSKIRAAVMTIRAQGRVL